MKRQRRTWRSENLRKKKLPVKNGRRNVLMKEGMEAETEAGPMREEAAMAGEAEREEITATATEEAVTVVMMSDRDAMMTTMIDDLATVTVIMTGPAIVMIMAEEIVVMMAITQRDLVIVMIMRDVKDVHTETRKAIGRGITGQEGVMMSVVDFPVLPVAVTGITIPVACIVVKETEGLLDILRQAKTDVHLGKGAKEMLLNRMAMIRS